MDSWRRSTPTTRHYKTCTSLTSRQLPRGMLNGSASGLRRARTSSSLPSTTSGVPHNSRSTRSSTTFTSSTRRSAMKILMTPSSSTVALPVTSPPGART
eukprot:3376569-Rhodomonas_salina.1